MPRQSVPRQPRAPRSGGRQEVRIIGGSWRRRKLSFADAPGLRPTPDRVRETLFNWLAPDLPGLHVLDLFAGSGCLGFEALSRGAASATLVESSPLVVRDLQRIRTELGAETARVIQADALEWLRQSPQQAYELVFVDPPFQLNLYTPTFQLLQVSGWLAAGAWIYVEAEVGRVPDWPPGWFQHRQLSAGNVVATLLRCL